MTDTHATTGAQRCPRSGLVVWAQTRRARLLPAFVGDAVLTGFFLAEGRRRRGRDARSLTAGPSDRGTTRGVGLAVVAAACAAPTAATLRVGRLPPVLGWLGVATMGAGLGLRVWSARVLGRYYTRTLRVADDQARARRGGGPRCSRLLQSNERRGGHARDRARGSLPGLPRAHGPASARHAARRRETGRRPMIPRRTAEAVIGRPGWT